VIYGQYGFRGLGQDDGPISEIPTGLDLSAYTDQSTITGLPVYAELGLGLLGVIVLSKLWAGTRTVAKGARRRIKAAL
jgi:hypothetical protein